MASAFLNGCVLREISLDVSLACAMVFCFDYLNCKHWVSLTVKCSAAYPVHDASTAVGTIGIRQTADNFVELHYNLDLF